MEGPLLCVGAPPLHPALQRILICSGGLHHAKAAVHLGGQIAAVLSATVTLLHVATPLSSLPHPVRDVPASAEAYLQGDTLYARNLRQAMAILRALGVEAAFCVRGSDPLTEILAEARAGGYDLVVIGSHRALAGPTRLVGDITHRIVEDAGRPVLVVKGPDSEAADPAHGKA